MQYSINGESIAPMGLIPVELDIEGLYEDHDRRRRKNGNEKVVSSHVHSVNTLRFQPWEYRADLYSAAVPKTAHHNEHSETEKRNT
jgi:hypothetical protein